jgi:hypothetical protein
MAAERLVCRGLSIMTGLAQGLVIGLVPEQLHVAAMGDAMIDHDCRDKYIMTMVRVNTMRNVETQLGAAVRRTSLASSRDSRDSPHATGGDLASTPHQAKKIRGTTKRHGMNASVCYVMVITSGSLVIRELSVSSDCHPPITFHKPTCRY